MVDGDGQVVANGSGADQQVAPPQINVLGHYVKEFSFENPNAPRVLQSAPKNPNIQIGFKVDKSDLGKDMHEVVLTLEATATSDDGLLYKMELVYAGGFRLRNLPPEAIGPVLLVECPALLFPFVRRIAADMTREGGFPPLLIDPIDFGSMFRQNMAEQSRTASA